MSVTVSRGPSEPLDAWYTAPVGIRRLLVIAILTICIGAPMVEAFDRWDHTLQDGYDTEATAVAAALCVGLALTVAAVVAQWIRSLGWRTRPGALVDDRPAVQHLTRTAPPPTCSPPIPIRV